MSSAIKQTKDKKSANQCLPPILEHCKVYRNLNFVSMYSVLSIRVSVLNSYSLTLLNYNYYSTVNVNSFYGKTLNKVYLFPTEDKI